MAKNFFLLIFILISQFTVANSEDPAVKMVDTLNKRIPAQLVDVVLKTLTHYPELDDTPIEFVFYNGMHNSFMQAKPKPFSLLKGHENRRYMVQMMSSMMINDTIIPIENLPEEALIGWIGHEVGHIVDYETMNVAQIIGFSLQYLFSRNFIIKTEERVDIIAIKHNLGSEIIAMKEYILNQPSLPDAYRGKIKNIYISPERVKELMRLNGFKD